MKTTYTIDRKRISKNDLIKKVGAERVKVMTAESWKRQQDEPGEAHQYWIGYGMLEINFGV
jgi:hypothetical protein